MSSNKINIRQRKSSTNPSGSSQPDSDRPKLQIKPKSAYPKKPAKRSFSQTVGEKFSTNIHSLKIFVSQLKYRKKALYISLGAVVVVLGVVGFIVYEKADTSFQETASTETKESTFKASDPSRGFYGIDTSKYQILEQGAFKAVESPLDILQNQHIPQEQISAIQQAMPNPLILTTPYPARKYTLLGTSQPEFMVIEPTDFEYWVWKLSDPVMIEKIDRDIVNKQESLAIIITGNLQKSSSRNVQLSHELESHIEQALSWQVDLFHLDPGSKLKVVYDVTYVDGEIYSIDQMPAVWLEDDQNTFAAYYFNQKPYEGYYDMNARPMKTTFLKAPVKYSSISSTFGTRFHPLEEKEKFHYGTDYAAKAGSPIYAVADGVVLAATFAPKSGYYVQLKHSDGYQTFYLHMQKNSFGEGIRKGATVTQGDIIGLVGATGSATGPHVCFHIRKDAKPIDPLSVGLPGREPIPPGYVPQFLSKRDSINRIFEQLTLFQ